MKLSKTKIILFFLALILLGWMLYPRALFLAYIYEGRRDLEKAITYYETYLEKKPYNKFAILRLASIYERLAKPEEALPYLERLYQYRRGDWKIAKFYLDYLERMGAEKNLYALRLMVADDLLKKKRSQRSNVEELLQALLEQAIGWQKTDEVYAIAQKLKQVSSNPSDADFFLEEMDRALKKKDRVLLSLKKKVLQNPGEVSSFKALGQFYLTDQEWREAEQVLQAGRNIHPEDTEILEMLALAFEKQKRWKEAVACIEKLLSIEDLSVVKRVSFRKRLVDLHAAGGNKEKALRVGQELLNENKMDPEMWDRVLSLLRDLRKKELLIEFLEKYLNLFPQDLKKEKWLAQVLLYEKRDLSVLAFYSQYFEHAGDISFGLDVAFLLHERGKIEEEKRWLEDIERKTPNEPDILMALSENFEARGERKEAQFYFQKLKGIVREEQKFVKTWFWLSEKEDALENKKDALLAANKVVVLLKNKSKFNEEEERMLLKSTAKVNPQFDIHRAYAEKIKRFPRSFGLRADFIDLLLQRKELKKAKIVLIEAVAEFPEESKNFRPYWIRLALQEKDWEEAKKLLEEFLREHPQSISYRKDLAYVSLRLGEWRKAIREYEALLKKAKDPLVLQELKEINALYDHRLQTFFRLTNYGADDLIETGVVTQGFFSEKLQFAGSIVRGMYDVPSLSFSGEADVGKFQWTFRQWYPWMVEAGLGFGRSNQRFSPSGIMGIRFQPGEGEFSVSFGLRELRTDLPQAVAHGTLKDFGRLRLQYTLGKRWNLFGTYHFSRNFLPGGEEAWEQNGESAFTYNFFEKSQLNVGYQFAFQHVSDTNNFLAKVPLIPEMRSHYLIAHGNLRPKDVLKMEADFFIGEDTERDLHLFEGDIWGVHAELQWHLTSHFDTEVSYDFGRETKVGIGGESHSVLLLFSGHWH